MDFSKINHTPTAPDQSEEDRLETVRTEIFKRKQYIIAICRQHILGQKNREEIIEEIADEVLFKAVKEAKSYKRESGATLETWLFKITINTIRDFFRRTSTKKSVQIADMDFIDTTSSPEESLILKESKERSKNRKEKLRNALEKLPPIQRKVLEMNLQGLGPEDIAKKLEMNANTTRSHLRKARMNLAKHIGRPPDSKMRG